VPYFPGGGIAEDFIANLGLPDLKLSVFVPMGGATCVAAIQTAAMAVATGVCKHVLISVGRTGYSGARVSTRLQQFPQFALAAEFEAPIGMFAPAQLYAQGARRHMELYGTTAALRRDRRGHAGTRSSKQRGDEQTAHGGGASRCA
jgi:acetyl-CoA acetyltransferase